MDDLSPVMFLVGILIVFLLLFLVFRELNCWYWKINKRIELSEEHNLLLKKILQHISNEKEISSTTGDYSDIAIGLGNGYDSLSVKEKREADKFVAYGFKPGDRLVINKKTREIDRFDEKEWNEILKNNQKDSWIIILEK